MAKDLARGARIRQLRGNRSLREYGLLFGASKQSVSAWERGTEPDAATLAAMAQDGETTVDWILTGHPAFRVGAIPYASRGRLIPLAGRTEETEVSVRHNRQLVARGASDASAKEAPKSVHTYFGCSPGSYALQVVGSSMEPEFHDGDVIVIDPEVEPEPGDFVWAEVKDHPHNLFRRFRPKSLCKSGRVKTADLIPLNPDWPIHSDLNLKTQARIKGTLVESAKQWARRSRR